MSRLVQARGGPMRYQASDIYLSDPAELAHGSRIKWFISTCVAATVGVAAIGAVIYGSIDSEERIESAGPGDRRPIWERVWDLERLRPVLQSPKIDARDGDVVAAKQDRLPQAVGGMVTRQVIHDSERQRRGAREMVVIHAYTRMTGRLSTAPPLNEARIPPFNPFRLYANLDPIDDGGGASARVGVGGDGEVAVKVVELLGGFLPEEDGQELENDEVAAMVTRSGEEIASRAEIRRTFTPDGAEPAPGTGLAKAGAPKSGASKTETALASPRGQEARPEEKTTVLVKSQTEADEDADVESKEVITKKVSQGETLVAILSRVGTELWQAKEINDVANETFPVAQLRDGNEVRLTLVPSPTNALVMELTPQPQTEPSARIA